MARAMIAFACSSQMVSGKAPPFTTPLTPRPALAVRDALTVLTPASRPSVVGTSRWTVTRTRRMPLASGAPVVALTQLSATCTSTCPVVALRS